ncbi:MAG: hypothetical protein DI528_08160 [Shinella sp.]|nr:MAG: hypothetical protein DI528_08160 [Shinella sp.]
MPAEARNADPVTMEDDLAQTVLDAHDGNAHAAIRELVADTIFLKGELYTASCLLSRGIGRGWTPRFEREE